MAHQNMIFIPVAMALLSWGLTPALALDQDGGTSRSIPPTILSETPRPEKSQNSSVIKVEDLPSVDEEELITNSTVVDQSSVKILKPDWRDNFGVLTIGYLVDGVRERQRRHLEPFRLALQRKSGLQVVMRPVNSLDELIRLQVDRRIQYALHSASSYVQTQLLCKCVEPLVVPTDQAGASSIHAIVIAPSNGKIRRLYDLKGNRLAVPAPPATITRLMALQNLKEEGYAESGDLGELIDVTHPVEGWRKILNDEADAVIGWSSMSGSQAEGYSQGTLKHIIETTQLAKSTDLRVVWQSEPVPHGPHVVRSDVPTELKDLLRDFLTTLNQKNRPAFESISSVLAGGFVLTEDSAFKPLYDLATALEK